MKASTVAPWVLAARPKTLAAAFVPVMVGTVLGAAESGQWYPGLALAALLGCFFLQVATNFFNDLIDHRKGADTAERLGPARMAASGGLQPRHLAAGGVFMLVAATACGAWLAAHRGWPIVAIGLPSLYLCYGYTGGPLPLAYRGLGEVFVILCFGLVAVGGSYYVQTGGFGWSPLLAGLQVGLLSSALIAINNFRDREEDAASGKRTLAVRFGPEFARWEILVFLLLPYDLGILWAFDGRPLATLLPFCLAIFGGVLGLTMFRLPPGPGCNRILGLSALHLLLFAVLLALGFALSGPPGS